ncbi:hypothetical protein AB838_10745 [Rhodobacteraceae bacterium (ex Bugula neritina AB1)]|nr:hypothetical protein AB838_10745 [Rhodobacteraceae bacterium (ex Bugula neritina AB1)]
MHKPALCQEPVADPVRRSRRQALPQARPPGLPASLFVKHWQGAEHWHVIRRRKTGLTSQIRAI